MRKDLQIRAWLCLPLLFCACGRAPNDADPDLAPQLLEESDELAAWIESFPSQRYRIVEIEGIGRFHLDDDNPDFVKQMLQSGIPWEPYLLEPLADHIRPGSTVLDVGAHIGSITMPMAGLVGPAGRVYAFEPQRKVFRELVHNLRLNGLQQVVPLRYAVGAENTIIEMDPVLTEEGHVAVGKGGDQAELRTLDSFGFSDVSLIKIDVEGFELEVLRGAAELIRRERPVLIVEIHQETEARDATFRQLDELGYAHRQISHAHDYLAWPR